MKETNFAPAKRTERRKFKNQLDTLSHSPIMNTLLGTMGGLLIVLNEDRQIVAINHTFLDLLGITDAEKVLGLRLGESLKCVHAHEEPHGCGTTPHCPTCGAAIAMMVAINEDRPSEEICALTADQEGVKNDMCLLIKTQPLQLEGNRWILVFAQDITQQQFWVNLERVFFHDVNNILTTLAGNSELLAMKYPESEEMRYIKDAAKRLCGEISWQRSLSRHKNVTCQINKNKTSTKAIQKEVDLIIVQHEAGKDKYIDATWPTENIPVFTDPLLVSRVLGNMTINALEATKEKGTISLITKVEPNHIIWEVWNNEYIPSTVQKRIFQRHFSTKSKNGRGLGTYSMKLLGEEYLKGRISFTSNKRSGTTFFFSLPRE